MSQLRVTVSHGKRVKRTSILSGMNGVCLAELLIGLAAGVVVLATALETFSIVRQHVTKQQRDLAYQQDLRLGLAVFEQEARLATAESIVIGRRPPATSLGGNRFLRCKTAVDGVKARRLPSAGCTCANCTGSRAQDNALSLRWQSRFNQRSQQEHQ
jgi:hypothetical protein